MKTETEVKVEVKMIMDRRVHSLVCRRDSTNYGVYIYKHYFSKVDLMYV